MDDQLKPEWIKEQLKRKPTQIEQRYFTPTEISVHNIPSDCWVSFLGKVYDLTNLVGQYPERLTKPIVEAAGKDISHWFVSSSRELVYHTDPDTGLRTPYLPQGAIVHAPPPVPRSDFATDFEEPWWNDQQYCIGWLSKKTRRITVINMLTEQEDVLLVRTFSPIRERVASEETILEILRRYLKINAHAASYTWKVLEKPLDMSKSLSENEIEDETETFEKHGIREDFYVPAIHLYFNDDLTVS